MRRFLMAAFIACIVCTGTAQAENITYEFEGTFQESDVDGWETFSVTLVYDNDATATETHAGNLVSKFGDTEAAITVTASGYTYQGASDSSVTYETVDGTYMGTL